MDGDGVTRNKAGLKVLRIHVQEVAFRALSAKGDGRGPVQGRHPKPKVRRASGSSPT